jgi:hypothetical protein
MFFNSRMQNIDLQVLYDHLEPLFFDNSKSGEYLQPIRKSISNKYNKGHD